jgi:hypothetical protein
LKVRSPNQKGVFEMAKPKHKSMKNQPEIYGEIKQPFTLSLTPTAVNILASHAKTHGISRSEVVEQFARSLEHLPTQVAFWVISSDPLLKRSHQNEN